MVREHGLWGNLLLNDKNLDIWNNVSLQDCSVWLQKTFGGGGGGQVVKESRVLGLCGVWRLHNVLRPVAGPRMWRMGMCRAWSL